jgi:thymidylate synthase (FAD)
MDKNIPKGKSNKLTKRFSAIKYIEYVGEQGTYDLEINHKSHNYVANGIITHNSQRYAEPKELGNMFEFRETRFQDTKNRQKSIDLDPADPSQVDIDKTWQEFQRSVAYVTGEYYKWAVSNGIAKEQARAILPEGLTKTRLYMNGSLRSWIHYIELRSDNGTQKEHMLIAKECAKVINQVFPMMKTPE